MLFLERPEFYSYDVAVKGEYVSINVMIKPRKFDLDTFKSEPFASFIIKDKHIACKISDNDDTAINGIIDNIFKHPIPNKYIEILNIYLDDEYERITSMFDGRVFHTVLIYFQDTITYTDIVLAAIPINGMLSPIEKSSFFNLYNGLFVHCKRPFLTNNAEIKSSNIVYLLIDLKTYFQMSTFDNKRTFDGKYGTETVYSFSIRKDSIQYSHYKKEIPLSGREHLFSKKCVNMFPLSDIPKDSNFKIL